MVLIHARSSVFLREQVGLATNIYHRMTTENNQMIHAKTKNKNRKRKKQPTNDIVYITFDIS